MKTTANTLKNNVARFMSLMVTLCAIPALAAPDIPASDADFTLDGVDPNEKFGFSMAGVGDVDGDGCDDFVVGGPGWNCNAGCVYLFSGKTHTIIWTREGFSDTCIDPKGAMEDNLGIAVAGAGDVDGDGVPDVIASSPSPSTFLLVPNVKVFSGASGATIYVLTPPPSPAHNDADDGDPHMTSVVPDGASGGPPTPEGFSVDYFGKAIAGGGDLDGDGVPDILVGEPRFGTPGFVHAFSGATGQLLFTRTGEAVNDLFGESIDFIPDFDGDGADDWIVEAPDNSAGGIVAGRAYLYSSTNTMPVQIYTGNPGPQFGQRLGEFVLFFGDITSDGSPEIIISGLSADRYEIVDVFSNQPIVIITPPHGNHFFPVSARISDITGDGIVDIAITGVVDEPSQTFLKRVFLYSGADQRLINTFTSMNVNESFAFSAVSLDTSGKVNSSTLLIGAKDYDLGANILSNEGRTYAFQLPFICSGDANNDAVVNGFDLAALLSQWGTAGTADLNGDGVVDGADLAQLLANWGPCP